MANSNIISDLKDKVIKEIIKDELIVKVIDSPDMGKELWDSSCMIDNKENHENGFTAHIFRSFQNPYVVIKNITFLAIMVDIPKTYNTIYVKPVLKIYIVSHNDHMRIENIIGVIDNRNDYLSILLDKKFNGMDYGLGTLELTSNIEGSYSKEFLYREMTFETTDLNDSLCLNE